MKNCKMAAAAVIAGVLALSGCGKDREAEVTVIHTPAPVSTSAPLPTATPIPTPAPTLPPRALGIKTTLSRILYFTNDTGRDLGELYIRLYGSEDWGKNLIPSGSFINDSERVQLYYMPQTAGEEETRYEMKLTDSSGNSYEIRGILLDRMSSALLKLEGEEAYLIYMDSVENLQKDSRKEEKTEERPEERPEGTREEDPVTEFEILDAPGFPDDGNTGNGSEVYVPEDPYPDQEVQEPSVEGDQEFTLEDPEDGLDIFQ